MAPQHEDGLSPEDAHKLVAILSMLDSDHAGERDAAGLAASRFIHARGVRWEHLIRPRLPAMTTPPTGWRAVARACLGRPGLSGKEQAFLDNLLTSFASPTVKQAAWLGDIARRLGIVT